MTHRHRLKFRSVCAVAAASLAIAACGGAGGSEEGGGSDPGPSDLPECPVGAYEDADGVTEITLWHAWAGMTRRTIESIAEDFNASQDKIKVNVESQGTYEEMLAKYEGALVDNNSLPDIVLSEETTTQFMIDSGTILPAQSCIDADEDSKAFYDQVLPAVTAGFTVDEVLWPSSFTVSQPILYFNESHFEAAGLDITDPPQTLDELRAAAQQIADAKATNPALGGVTNPLVLRLDAWLVESLLAGVDQPVVDNDNGRAGLATESEFDNEQTVRALEWYKSMQADGLMKGMSYSQPFDHLFAMALGNASMLVDTSTAITSVNGAIEGTLTADDLGVEGGDIDFSAIKLDTLRIGVGLNPGFDAAGRGQIGGAGWYIVDRGDDAAASAAWEFLGYNNETPQQVRWTLEGSYLPSSEAAREDSTLQEEFDTTRRGKWLAIASEGLNELNPEFPGPVIGPYNVFRAEVRSGMERVALGDGDVTATIAAINDKFQSALTTYAEDVGA